MDWKIEVNDVGLVITQHSDVVLIEDDDIRFFNQDLQKKIRTFLK